MAISTRASNVPKPAAKAPSQPKASSSAKKASRTKCTRKAAQKTAPGNDNAIEIPTTPSQGTLTPDRVEKTDIKFHDDHDVIRRIIQREFAKARSSQLGSDRLDTHRVHKSRSHSRRRRHRHHNYSSESSTDSEEGDRPRVSFLHHDKGRKPFLDLDLAARFPTVHTKYFKQIFHGTFQPENLAKLGVRITDRAAAEAPQEMKGVVHMLLCLEIYGQIVVHFSAVPLRDRLQQSLSQYRVSLMQMLDIYKFGPIRAYNATFMRTRILLGQDDAAAWDLYDRRCSSLPVQKTCPNEKGFKKAKSIARHTKRFSQSKTRQKLQLR